MIKKFRHPEQMSPWAQPPEINSSLALDYKFGPLYNNSITLLRAALGSKTNDNFLIVKLRVINYRFKLITISVFMSYGER